MSSHSYVTQQNTPLAGDTALMSTTDLQSYIIYASDTFMQVSDYTLQESQGQPHSMVRYPDMPEAAFADMRFTLEEGKPWSGIVKNRRKNGDHYWVWANVVPMVHGGEASGYMSIHTRATDEEIAVVEPLYKASNTGRTSKCIHKGPMMRKGRLGRLPSLSFRWRVHGVTALMFIVLAAMLWFVATPVVTCSLCALTMLLGNTCFERQIVRPIENVANQVLRVATGERDSIEHLERSDELELTLCTVGQLGLMCRWLINDVSSQASSVRNDSETLTKGTSELNEHTQQTVDNIRRTVATMNQVAASVEQSPTTASTANKLPTAVSNAAVQGRGAMIMATKTTDDIADNTQRVGTTTSLTNDIVFQTNILALNAAVEATRAGKQGKGFVVVAEEVHHLASRSVNTADDIRKLIDASIDKVQSGSQWVHAVGRTMEDIVARVKNVIQLVAQISHPTLGRADGLSSLTRAVDEPNLITQKNTKLVEESTQASVMVKHRASRLEDVVTVLH